MVQIDLTREEQNVLREALRIYVSNLAFEIGDTDDRAYRIMLKERERVLRHVLEQLNTTAPEPTSTQSLH